MRRIPFAALSILAASRAGAAVLPERGFGLPRDVSLDGRHIDSLIHFTLIAIALIFAVVLAMLVWSVARRGRCASAAYDPGSRRSVFLLLGGVAAISVVVDGTLFVRTLEDMNGIFWNFSGAEANPAAVRIEVNAHQWAWTARYAGPDGKFNTPDDIVTLNDIRVPTGAPVVIQIASTDVIHSFYVPNLRVKRDAMPGMVNGLTFQAQVPGEYEIGCAQHCGPNHYKMRGILTVLSPEQYRDWLATAGAIALRAYDPDDASAHWGWEWRSL